MASQITVRGVPKDLANRLAKLAAQRRQSVNSLVLSLLSQAAGIDGRRSRLARYATWSADDLAEFEGASHEHRRIDPELWR